MGNAGLFVVGSLIYAALGDHKHSDGLMSKLAEAATLVLPVGFLKCGGDEPFVGRAGYLFAILMLR